MTKRILFEISNFDYSRLPAGRGICLGFGACHLVLAPFKIVYSFLLTPKRILRIGEKEITDGFDIFSFYIEAPSR